jgi:hypothetical protein
MIGPQGGSEHVLWVDHCSRWSHDWQRGGPARVANDRAHEAGPSYDHAILNTAVDDELIRRNPCRIAGAGQDTADERPTATLDEVFRIASAIQPRYRLLVWLACFASLRFGELIGLRRRHVFPDVPELKVAVATGELDGGIQYDDDPKSDAGKRTIALPAAIAAELSEHLKVFAQPGPARTLVRRSTRCHPEAAELQPCVEGGTKSGTGEPGPAPARPPSHGSDARRTTGQPEGAHGADRAQQYSGRHDLPARDQRARPRDRGSAGPDDPGSTGGARRLIWHASGTTAV